MKINDHDIVNLFSIIYVEGDSLETGMILHMKDGGINKVDDEYIEKVKKMMAVVNRAVERNTW